MMDDKEKDIKGNLGEVLYAMLNEGTDCCAVTYRKDDFAITVDITITKIVKGQELVYDCESCDEVG
jgi:hypothetical protein